MGFDQWQTPNAEIESIILACSTNSDSEIHHFDDFEMENIFDSIGKYNLEEFFANNSTFFKRMDYREYNSAHLKKVVTRVFFTPFQYSFFYSIT